LLLAASTGNRYSGESTEIGTFTRVTIACNLINFSISTDVQQVTQLLKVPVLAKLPVIGTFTSTGTFTGMFL
jgi:hypothetical protein